MGETPAILLHNSKYTTNLGAIQRASLRRFFPWNQAWKNANGDLNTPFNESGKMLAK